MQHLACSRCVGAAAVDMLCRNDVFRQQGLVDIDTPIKNYGVSPTLAVWNASGTMRKREREMSFNSDLLFWARCS